MQTVLGLCKKHAYNEFTQLKYVAICCYVFAMLLLCSCVAVFCVLHCILQTYSRGWRMSHRGTSAFAISSEEDDDLHGVVKHLLKTCQDQA